jgi:hypothetical protein
MPVIPRAAIDRAVLAHFVDHIVDVEATQAAFAAEKDRNVLELESRAKAAAKRTREAEAKRQRMADFVAQGRLEPEDLVPFKEDAAKAGAAADEALDRFNDARSAEIPADIEQRVVERLTGLQAQVGEAAGKSRGSSKELRAQLATVFECFVVYGGTYDAPRGCPTRCRTS